MVVVALVVFVEPPVGMKVLVLVVPSLVGSTSVSVSQSVSSSSSSSSSEVCGADVVVVPFCSVELPVGFDSSVEPPVGNNVGVVSLVGMSVSHSVSSSSSSSDVLGNNVNPVDDLEVVVGMDISGNEIPPVLLVVVEANELVSSSHSSSSSSSSVVDDWVPGNKSLRKSLGLPLPLVVVVAVVTSDPPFPSVLVTTLEPDDELSLGKRSGMKKP